jgi:hypothetical protein
VLLGGGERKRAKEKFSVLVKVRCRLWDVKNGKKKGRVDNWKEESQKVNFYELVLAFRFDLYSSFLCLLL